MRIVMNDNTVFFTDKVLSFALGYVYIDTTKVLVRNIVAIEPIKK